MRYLWHALAAFGDSSVLLPCGALVALVLLPRISTRKLCGAWLALLVGTGAIVAATKVLYMGWGFGLASVDFTGLSGHAALSFLVWPVTFFLFFGQARTARALAAAAATALAAAVSVSRLQTHAHSVSEVVLGGILGGGISSFYLVHYRRILQTVAPRRWLAVILAVPLVIGYVHAAPTESILAALARALSGHSYVYTRADLHSSAIRGPTAAPRGSGVAVNPPTTDPAWRAGLSVKGRPAMAEDVLTAGEAVCEVLKGVAIPVCNEQHTYSRGDCFGVSSLLPKHRRLTDVVAGSDHHRVLRPLRTT